MPNLTLSQVKTFSQCIKREIDFRKRVYPKFIEKGKMTQQKADSEIKTMEEILNYFDRLYIEIEPEQQRMF